MNIHACIVGCFDDDFMSRITRGASKRERYNTDSNCHIDYFTPKLTFREQTHEQAIRRCVLQALSLSPHIICPIGVLAARVTIEECEKLSNPPYVCFTATVCPDELGLIKTFESPGNLITGVELTPVPTLFPAQMFLDEYPKVKKMLLVCNPKNRQGRVGYDAEKISEFLSQQGKKVDTLNIDDSQRNTSLGLIKKKITDTSYDAVMFVSGDQSVRLHKELINVCLDKNIHLVADGKDVAKRGLVFGLSHDIEFLGESLREKIEAIGDLLMTTPPAKMHSLNIPVNVIPNEFTLFLGKGEGGVILKADTVFNHEEDPHGRGDVYKSKIPVKYSSNPRCNIGFFGFTAIPQHRQILKFLIKEADRGKTIDYTLQPVRLRHSENLSITKETREDMRDALKGHANGTGVQLNIIFSCTKKITEEIQKICSQLKIDIPIFSLDMVNRESYHEILKRHTEQEKEPIVFDTYFSHTPLVAEQNKNNNTISCIIRSIDLNVLINTAQLFMPTIKTVLYVEQSSTPETEHFFQKNSDNNTGITYIRASLDQYDSIKSLLQDYKGKIDALIICDHLVPTNSAIQAESFCRSNAILPLIIGLSLVEHTIPLSFGYNWLSLCRFFIHRVTHQVISEGSKIESIGSHVAHINEHIAINKEAWSEKMGNFSGAHKLLLNDALFLEPGEKLGTLFEYPYEYENEPIETITLNLIDIKQKD